MPDRERKRVRIRRTWCPKCGFFIHTSERVPWHRIRVCNFHNPNAPQGPAPPSPSEEALKQMRELRETQATRQRQMQGYHPYGC